MLGKDLRRRHEAANRSDRAAWAQIRSREDWERFLARRLEALRASLGQFPSAGAWCRVPGAGGREPGAGSQEPGAGCRVPGAGRTKRQAVVVALAQHGKDRFLQERAGEVAALVAGGAAVCLPDLRGTGETRLDGSREIRGEISSISATEWMLGQTLLGSRLRDLRAVLRYLRARSDVDPARFALWGDSFAPVNPPGFADPLLGEEEPPLYCEPLGGLLALFGALYEEGIAAVAVRGTLAGYLSVLRDAYCYVPHDAIVPGALTAGDLCDIAAALAPRPLWLEGLVDGRNCLLAETEVRRHFEPTIRAYHAAGGTLRIRAAPASDLAAWLLGSLFDSAP